MPPAAALWHGRGSSMRALFGLTAPPLVQYRSTARNRAPVTAFVTAINMHDANPAKPTVNRAKAYLKVRHKTVRDMMKELKLDGMLLTHPPDLEWLTNFTGDDSIGLVTEKDFHLITD